jgi:hypothetical protein
MDIRRVAQECYRAGQMPPVFLCFGKRRVEPAVEQCACHPSISGKIQNLQSTCKAQPPKKSACPGLRAGYREAVITEILIKRMKDQSDPVAMGKNSPGTRLSAAARTFATIYGKIFDVGKRRPAGKANCYGGIHVTLHDIAYGSGNGSDRVSKAKDLPISRHLASGRRQSAWRS